MSRGYAADLHIHTCLSPCADLEMTPREIVRKAVEVELDIVAITDHNSGKNAGAVVEAAAGLPLTVIAGMEVQSREEVHLLSLFNDLEALQEWDSFIYEHLPDVPNDPDIFGYQPIVDAPGCVLRFEEKLLISSVDLSVEEIVYGVRDRDGVCIASHVDREAFSIIGQLGYIPPGLPLDGVEIVLDKESGSVAGYEAITASDAHFLQDIGVRYTVFLLNAPTLKEIRRALQEAGEHRVLRLA